jgi:ribose transport system permease protein
VQPLLSRISNDKFFGHIAKNFVLFIFLIFLAVFTIFKPQFWSLENVHNVLLDASILGVVGCAVTYALINGHLDLSIGPQYACYQIAFIALLNANINPIACIPLILVLALVFGSINGTIVVFGKINPFITTLATRSVFLGIALIYTKGDLIGTSNKAVAAFGTGRLFGVSYIIYIYMVFLVVFWFVLKFTKYGRRLIATGGDPYVAELSGINVKFIQFSIFIIISIATAFAGMMLVSMVRAGSVLYGSEMGLTAITAAIIGGSSFVGGRGTIIGTFFGVIVISVLYKALFYMGMGGYLQDVIKGTVIIAVVSIDAYLAIKKSKRKQ